MIHKKGISYLCDNYRATPVASTTSRLYSEVLKTTLEEDYQRFELEQQSGFGAGKSCVDNIYCLMQVMEKSMDVGKDKHLLIYAKHTTAFLSVKCGSF